MMMVTLASDRLCYCQLSAYQPLPPDCPGQGCQGHAVDADVAVDVDVAVGADVHVLKHHVY